MGKKEREREGNSIFYVAFMLLVCVCVLKRLEQENFKLVLAEWQNELNGCRSALRLKCFGFQKLKNKSSCGG